MGTFGSNKKKAEILIAIVFANYFVIFIISNYMNTYNEAGEIMQFKHLKFQFFHFLRGMITKPR